MNILTLITLKLNHISHFTVVDDCTIAGKFLLDYLENLLLIELGRETLNRGQSLATIALCDTVSTRGLPSEVMGFRTLNPNMDVVLRLFGLAVVFVGLREGVYSKAD